MPNPVCPVCSKPIGFFTKTVARNGTPVHGECYTEYDETIKDDPILVDEKGSSSDLVTLEEGCNRFALDLYSQVRGKSGNLFFSPSSIAMAFAMAYAGARGETASEMAEVLHFDLPPQQLHAAFAALNKLINPHEKPYELKVANRLWGQRGYPILSEYLSITRDYYGGEMSLLDFVTAAEAASKEINAWVAENTNDKIQNIVSPDSFNELTRLVLANAIYFKGTWESPFNKGHTADAPFYGVVDEQQNVPFMHQTEDMSYAETDELQLLALPYQGNDLSMLIILPKEIDGLSRIEEQLTNGNVTQWKSNLISREVKLAMPKFVMTDTLDLCEVLSALGMIKAFEFGIADFSGITSQEPLFISTARHIAYVDVNEEGTEAAAVTIEMLTGWSAPEEEPVSFRADHPFLFMIQHEVTDSILFLGRVVSPQT